MLTTKLISGRFWLTIMAGVVFAIAAFKGTLSSEAVSGILVMIFRDYFARNRDNEVLK